MKRSSNLKTLKCCQCDTDCVCGSEATRVLCPTCTMAGKRFPEARTGDLFDQENYKPQVEVAA